MTKPRRFAVIAVAAGIVLGTAAAPYAMPSTPRATSSIAATLPSALPSPALGHPGNPVIVPTSLLSVSGVAGSLVHIRLAHPVPADVANNAINTWHFTGAWAAVAVIGSPIDPHSFGWKYLSVQARPGIVCPLQPCRMQGGGVAAAQLPAGDYVVALFGPAGSHITYAQGQRFRTLPTTRIGHLYQLPYRTKEVPAVPAGSQDLTVKQQLGTAQGGRYYTWTTARETLEVQVLGVSSPQGQSDDLNYCWDAPISSTFYTLGPGCNGSHFSVSSSDFVVDGTPTPKGAYGEVVGDIVDNTNEDTRGATWTGACASCVVHDWWAALDFDGWDAPKPIRMAPVHLPVTAPSIPPASTLTGQAVRLSAGGGGEAQVRFASAAERRRVDVMALIDRTGSMRSHLPTATAGLKRALVALQRAGVDIESGVGLVGSAPVPGDQNGGGNQNPDAYDPTRDAKNPRYQRPVLFTRAAAVGPIGTALAALTGVPMEVLAVQGVDSSCCSIYLRAEGHAVAIEQLLTGKGWDETGQTYAGALPPNPVPPGLIAGWRSDPTVQRLLVDVTDGYLDAPDAPIEATGRPAHAQLARLIAGLVGQRVHHLGLVAAGDVAATNDLSMLSAGTGSYVPAGGLRCGGPTGSSRVPAGAPFVCNADAAALALQTAVMKLTSPTTVRIVADAGPVNRAVSFTTTVDSYFSQRLNVALPVTCPADSAGQQYAVPVRAIARGVVAARTVVAVTCAAAPAAVAAPAVRGVVPQPAPPAPAPVAQPAAPPAPPGQPAVNLQGAKSTQTQQGPVAQLAMSEQDQIAVQTAEQHARDLPLAWLGAAAMMTAAAAAVAVRRRTAFARQRR